MRLKTSNSKNMFVKSQKPHHFVDQQIAKIITATFCFYLVFGVLGLWWSNNVLKYVEQGTQYIEYTSNHSLFK